MFKKVSQLAEQMATSASRREFLGRFGRAALVSAAALGGFLALSGSAEASRRCATDADCRNGLVCRGGRCRPPDACGPGSVPECVGRVVGSSCGPFGYGNYCFGAPNCACGTTGHGPSASAAWRRR